MKIAIEHALARRQPSLTLPAIVDFEGTWRRVALHVSPIVPDESTARQVLVVFLDGGEIDNAEALEAGELAAKPAESRRLYEELKIAHERLNASRHEHDLAIQDLRAANEELQSINEEYRSTAEELETSKEELQSINEELQTVNAELKGKLENISSAHNDLQNLTTATEIGTLFLDTELRIRMFTPPVAELFNIYEGDVGRSISDFTHQMKYDGILADARRVLRDLSTFESIVENQVGRSFMMRLRPYRTLEDRIEGIVITFVDVTARLQAEQQLRQSEARYRTLFSSIDEGFCIVEVIFDTHGGACDYRFIEVNAAFERHTGLVDVVGKTIRTLVPEHETYWYETFGRIVKTGVPERFESRAAALGRFYDGYAFPMSEPNRMGSRFRDISERKQAEGRLKLMVDELNHRVKNTLAVVRSVARQTFKEGVVAAPAELAFQGRLASVAAAHNLLTGTHWSKTQLDEVVQAIVKSCSADVIRYRIDGPTIVLTAPQAVSMSMALHELCINAIKYGSLSVEGGYVEVSWQTSGDDVQPRFNLTWREFGGPPVKPPQRRGFGSMMVEQALAYELRGSASVEYLRDGVVCTIEAPLEASLQATFNAQ